jgi:hypothetical protein
VLSPPLLVHGLEFDPLKVLQGVAGGHRQRCSAPRQSRRETRTCDKQSSRRAWREEETINIISDNNPSSSDTLVYRHLFSFHHNTLLSWEPYGGQLSDISHDLEEHLRRGGRLGVGARVDHQGS